MPETTSTFSDVVKFTIPEMSIDNAVFATTADTLYKKMIPVSINADGKYVPTNPSADDGTQITVGLLVKEIPLQSTAGEVRVSILKRLARVVVDGINWTASTWTEEQKATAIEELAVQLIIKTTEA